ncbi:MAG: hypothetical protein V4751_05580 [Pseudomonadota bacterium]
MNQQINLFLPEFRPQNDWLTGNRVLQVSAVVLLIIVATTVSNLVQRSGLRSELASATDALEQLTDRTNELQQEVARRGSDPELARELEQREQRLAESQELLSFLSETNLGNIDGFSEHIKDLSRASFDGLWLTQFNMTAGGESVYIKGLTHQSAMVPNFIGRLADGKSPLRERNFSRFLGNRVNTAPVEGLEGAELYQFELETRQ